MEEGNNVQKRPCLSTPRVWIFCEQNTHMVCQNDKPPPQTNPSPKARAHIHIGHTTCQETHPQARLKRNSPHKEQEREKKDRVYFLLPFKKYPLSCGRQLCTEQALLLQFGPIDLKISYRNIMFPSMMNAVAIFSCCNTHIIATTTIHLTYDWMPFETCLNVVAHVSFHL